MSEIFDKTVLTRLSDEQLQELVEEVGSDCRPLAVEINARMLMGRLPWLGRVHALRLITDAEEVADEGSTIEKMLAHLFVRSEMSMGEVQDLRAYLGPFGIKVLNRAIRRYQRDPAKRGRNQLAEDLLLGIYETHKDEEDLDGDKASAEFTQHAKSFEPDLKLRQLLADEYDIHSPADFASMLQAMRIVAKANQSTWLRGGRDMQDALTRKARRLYEDAKAQPCSPQALWDWRRLVESGQMAKNPNAVYRRPDGVEIWGNGDLVTKDKDGNISRVMETIFGIKMPQGSVPLEHELMDMVQRAYPEQV